jgi:putative addiction module component (TIGR02574 family)
MNGSGQFDPRHLRDENPHIAATIEQLTQDALTLSETERAHLAHTLLQSLEPTSESGVDEAWDAEVARRLEQVRQGTPQGRPADEVFRDIRARHLK